MKIASLVECADWDELYGFLAIENDNVSLIDIQYKIYEIKRRLDEDGGDWCIDNVITQLPEEWKVRYIWGNNNSKIEI